MIQLNPRYDAIFNPDNIDLKLRVSESNVKSCLNIAEREQARPKVNCDGITSLMNVEVDFIKEALDAGLYKQTARITSDFIHPTSAFVLRTMAFLHT